jgi:ubiquinone/menaquinone biosynthesis C-methylase UbiE
MNNKKQKDIFIASEADAWYERNFMQISVRNYELDDPIIKAIRKCIEPMDSKDARVLEIGCSDGRRLEYIHRKLGLECYGLDPSMKALAEAKNKDIYVVRGTADNLPYDDLTFDIIIFGFCLYLCDRGDLFRIAQEADRVLKKNSWIIIHDFFSNNHVENHYSHHNDILSFKMDYRKLFDWHPFYACFYHEIRHHLSSDFTDDQAEWLATSIIRKYSA